MCLFIFFFFFSSRRRHTRSYGDWSSDVCSSDLVVGDADVGGEGRDDRAVLLEREIDGAAGLGLVQADARDREDEVESGVAPRLLLATRAPQGHLEGPERHALLLEDHHDV